MNSRDEHEEHTEHTKITERDRWLARAFELQREYPDMPREWADGIAAIELMRQPADAKPERWAQIVADSTRFACRWYAHLIEHGWPLAEVFGFDPDHDHAIGIVLQLRGRIARLVDRNTVTVGGSGWTILIHRHGADLAPLWTLNRRTARQDDE